MNRIPPYKEVGHSGTGLVNQSEQTCLMWEKGTQVDECRSTTKSKVITDVAMMIITAVTGTENLHVKFALGSFTD